MPETIGFLILSAAGVTDIAGFAITASTASIVGNVALASAAIAASYALSPTAPQVKPQDGQLTTRQAIPNRRRNYGLVKVAGPLMFSETLDGRRYQVIALNQGEIDSFVTHWFADVPAVVDPATNEVTNLYLNPKTGAPCVDLWTANGTDTDAAFAVLVGLFPSLWTSAHRGKGIAKVLTMTAQPPSDLFTQVYPGGQPPVYRGVIQSSKVWDPRDPDQDKDDKDTWAFTVNAALIILDYHRHSDGMGLAVYDGTFLTAAALAEDWIPAANICDEAVLNKDSTTASRYQCCGGYELPQPPKDVLAAMLATCDGQTYLRADGAIGIRVGKTISPTVTITDDHIIGYEGFHNGPIGALIPVNQVTAKYTDPALDFQEVAADPWLDAVGIAETGRTETRDLQLQWVPAHPQARRLMKLGMKRANAEWTGRVITDLDGLRAWGERYIHLVIAELGVDGTFELTAPPELTVATMTVVLTVGSLDQSAFNWDPLTEEGTAPTVPEAGSTVDTIDPPTGLSLSGVAGHVITVAWDNPTRTDVVADAQYSVHDDDNWFAMSVNDTNNGAVSPVLTAATYDVRVRFRVGTNSSNWVPLISIVVT